MVSLGSSCAGWRRKEQGVQVEINMGEKRPSAQKTDAEKGPQSCSRQHLRKRSLQRASTMLSCCSEAGVSGHRLFLQILLHQVQKPRVLTCFLVHWVTAFLACSTELRCYMRLLETKEVAAFLQETALQ